jgi:triosephosphate isomerase
MAFSGKKIIAGNWKMNGLKESAWILANGITERFDAGGAAKNFEMVICPPATLLSEISQMLEGYPIAIGAQNCADHESGAYTGEISPAMLKDIGCRFVILGHSERRAYYGETSAFVAAKARLAIQTGLVPIICIGETLAEREAGRAVEVVSAQFAESTPENATADNVIIAYEPVWAIGTGKSASAADIT